MGRIKNVVKALLGMPLPKEIYAVPHFVNEKELLQGKIALIVGGNGGIGASIAKCFIKNGCKVILAARNEEKLNDVINGIENEFGSLKMVQKFILDICEVEKLNKKLTECISLFPEKRIDILVNSAGINSTNNFWNYTPEEYDRIMNVNIRGTFFVSQFISNYMRNNGIKGHILNVSSSSALRPAKTAYEISKWGITGFTKGLADLCLPYGIIVNAIAPGPVMTDMLGKNENDDIYSDFTICGRYGLPNEIAELAVFMVSDFGNLIVGDTYYITGGSGVITYHR